MKSILVSLLLIFSLSLNQCASKSKSGFVFNPAPFAMAPQGLQKNSYNSETDNGDIGEDFTDKTGYVILGLAGAALTAAAIVLPIMLTKK